MLTDRTQQILVDGHAHFHRGCRAEDFLSSACENLRRAASAPADSASPGFVLAMVDGAGEVGFDRLCDAVLEGDGPSEDPERWSRLATEEPISACFRRGGDTIVVLRGRQVRTAENLEVLAIGVSDRLDDGMPAEDAIGAVSGAGGVPVIPWGFGKWLGRRGRVVRALLDNADPASLYIGDNANRPAAWRRPSAFGYAEALGFRVLPGSDPLPLPGECRTVGRAGFALPGPLDLRRPAADVRRRLMDTSSPVHPFAQLEGAVRFLRNQLAMQRIKRSR